MSGEKLDTAIIALMTQVCTSHHRAVLWRESCNWMSPPKPYVVTGGAFWRWLHLGCVMLGLGVPHLGCEHYLPKGQVAWIDYKGKKESFLLLICCCLLPALQCRSAMSPCLGATPLPTKPAQTARKNKPFFSFKFEC